MFVVDWNWWYFIFRKYNYSIDTPMIFDTGISGMGYAPDDDNENYSQDNKYCVECGCRFPEYEEFHNTPDGEMCNECYIEYNKEQD